jgi:hypothetical protein
MRDERIQSAVNTFWTTRADQAAKLADGGSAGGGARAAGHLYGFTSLIGDVFVAAGLPRSSVLLEASLPGYYRARKRWDMAVLYKGALVAAFEFKSQVGSVGKNINNRFEEALGSATDMWAAQRFNESFGQVAPWLGYVFVLQETAETERKPKRAAKTLFHADQSFGSMTYSQRYQEMLRRFIGDDIYQAGWFLTTRIEPDGSPSWAEPLLTATGKSFEAAIQGRVDYVRSIVDG